ncbi:MAG TPA: hypothetical protein VJ949_02065 [Cryomorphaceae bacterium]|nr:hypothetical protein [Cryomorphaceae bacterium]
MKNQFDQNLQIRKKITALRIAFILLTLLLAYHLIIITELIPFDKVWAGRLKSKEEMLVFETFSILIVVGILAVLFAKYRQLRKGIRNRATNIFIWIIAAFFALNSVGNLFAESKVELVLGTALTLTLSVLCFVVARR